MDSLVRLYFRPTRVPTVPLPFGARSVGHYHVSLGRKDTVKKKDFLQLFWGISGTMRFHLRKEELLLSGGQVFFYLPGDVHYIEIVSELAEYRWLTIDGVGKSGLMESFRKKQTIWEAGACPVELFSQLEMQIRNNTPSGQYQASALAYGIICAAVGKTVEPTEHGITRQAISIIHDEFDDPHLSISLLAEKMSIHRSTLSRIFRNDMGVSISSYLISHRMQKALSLLKETSFCVAEIADRTGYDDPNYFCKAIKRATGLSPSEFRRQ